MQDDQTPHTAAELRDEMRTALAAAQAEVERLTAENEALRRPSGYWLTDDREYGHASVDDLLEDADRSDIIGVTPWSDLPEVFFVWNGDEDDMGWVEFPTMEAARAALEQRP